MSAFFCLELCLFSFVQDKLLNKLGFSGELVKAKKDCSFLKKRTKKALKSGVSVAVKFTKTPPNFAQRA